MLASAALVAVGAIIGASPVLADETPDQRYVLGIERIWDRPGHAAFTDVVLHGEYLYCTFREGSGHIPGLNGQVRVIRSRDRMNWESVALLEEPHVDLRDPKLAITPDDRVMVNMGASFYHGSKRLGIESRVAFAEADGRTFGSPTKVVFPKEMTSGADWLWRITWHEGVAWGCVQQLAEDSEGKVERTLRLARSRDGVHFDYVARLAVDAPSETTLRFGPDETMLAMIRCEGSPKIGRMGASRPPYTDWKFVDSNKRFGGPNFIHLGGDRWLAGSRAYEPDGAKTQLWWLDPASGRCRDLLTFPSSGDNSYPGIAIDRPGRRVYVSYYSSHEGKAAIYLATLRLEALESAAR
jgi:hypothetical protein